MTARSAPHPLGAGATAKPGELTFCYEVGRLIGGLGHASEVVPLSLIPRRQGDRVRTNRAIAEAVADGSLAPMVTALIAKPASVSEPNRFEAGSSPAMTTARWTGPNASRREMAPQRLEIIESAPGNGMASAASCPQDLVRGRSILRQPLRRRLSGRRKPSFRATLSGVATLAAKAVCAALARNTSLRAKRSTRRSIP